MRQTDTEITAEELSARDARVEAERLTMWRARLRFGGTVGFGALTLWNLTPSNQGENTWMWLVAAVLVLGLASSDQILKAIGKG